MRLLTLLGLGLPLPFSGFCLQLADIIAMMATSPRVCSLIRTSSEILLDSAPHEGFDRKSYQRDWTAKRRGGPARQRSLPAPIPSDKIPADICRSCGMSGQGQHENLEACISALRDRLARFE